MSKKYFTKYLPIEGEIKEGDRVYFNDPLKRKMNDWSGNATVYSIKGDHYMIDLRHTTTDASLRDLKKLKLFLCSRDIQVGDKFYNTEIPNKEYLASHITSSDVDCSVHDCSVPRKYVYKVIGEVSPEATWINEGDQFDDNEIQQVILEHSWGKKTFITKEETAKAIYGDLFSHIEYSDSKSGFVGIAIKKYKIKCSNCKTYH